jgi:hypothetical protein
MLDEHQRRVLSMGIGTFGLRKNKWAPASSTMQHAQAWRARRKVMRDHFDSVNRAMLGAITGAQTNLSSGIAELAIKAATQRVRDEARARLEKAATETDAKLGAIGDKVDKTA